MGIHRRKARHQERALYLARKSMGVMYRIIYHEQVARQDIPSLSALWREKIRHAIETKLVVNPEIFGIPLRNTLKDYRKLRVGDYRVIFRIESMTVRVFAIGHRSNIYLLSNRRIGM